MNRKQLWILGLGMAVVVCLWLLAGSIGGFPFKDGHFLYRSAQEAAPAQELPPTAVSPTPDWIKVVFFILVWVLFPTSIVMAIFNPRLLKSALLRALGLSVWALAVVVLSQAFNRLSNSLSAGLSGAGGDNALVADSSAFPDPSAIVIPPWTQAVASLLAVLIGLWLFWRLRRYWRKARGQLSPDLEIALATEAGQAAAALRSGAPLREVVLRCYQGMCQLLADKQRQSHESLTPREFEAHLSKAGIVDPFISRLSRLFERVRYGAYQAVSEDEQEALSCLESIEKRYRSAV